MVFGLLGSTAQTATMALKPLTTYEDPLILAISTCADWIRH